MTPDPLARYQEGLSLLWTTAIDCRVKSETMRSPTLRALLLLLAEKFSLDAGDLADAIMAEKQARRRGSRR